MVLLNGYASKRCARRVHNDFDATIPKVDRPTPPELQERFDAGRAFEARVVDSLREALGDDLLVVPEGAAAAEIGETVAGMRRGVLVVAGGRLPPDVDGARSGKPDLLVRRTGADEPPGYVPVDVKHHLMTKTAATKTLAMSTLRTPDVVETLAGRSVRLSDRLDDWLQVAHYTGCCRPVVSTLA